MNKIELGWTFGKVCVWVAWLERRVGLPFTWKSSAKTQMIKNKNLTSPNLLLTESSQLSLCPAALLGIVLIHGQVCQGDRLCIDQQETRGRSPSYSQMLDVFFREYRVWSSLSFSLSTLTSYFSSEKAVFSAWLVKRGWFIVVSQNLFIVVFRRISKIHGHSEKVKKSLSLENLVQRGCKWTFFCDLCKVMSEGRRIHDSKASYDPGTLKLCTVQLSYWKGPCTPALIYWYSS